MSKIIGISGKIGSGKSEVAKIIKELYPQFDFKIVAFADKLRDVYEIITNEKIASGKDYSQEWKLDKAPYLNISRRQVLQGVGDGLRNIIDQDIWVNALVTSFNIGENYIVHDVRYLNELKRLEGLGGKIIRVIRNNNIIGNNGTHVSDLALDDYEMDVIFNFSDLVELKNSVKEYFDEYLF